MPEKIAGAGIDAGRNLLEYGALGSMVVILSVALFLSVRGWLRAKDQHMADKDRAAKVLKEQAVEANALALQTQQWVDGLVKRIDGQDQVLQGLGKQIDALALALTDLDKAAYFQAKGGK